MGEPTGDVPADLRVLVQVVGEMPLVEPVGFPVVDVPDADRFWMDFCPIARLFLRCQQDRQVARAFPDPGRAAHGSRPEPLDRGALVGVDRLDVQILAHEFVIVLRVGDRRLQRLAPVTRDRSGRVGQDSSRILDALAADVVTDQPGLASRRPDVFGLRPDDRGREARIPPGPAPGGRRLRGSLRRVGLGLRRAAAQPPAAPGAAAFSAGSASSAESSSSESLASSDRWRPRPRRRPRPSRPRPRPALRRLPGSARPRRPGLVIGLGRRLSGRDGRCLVGLRLPSAATASGLLFVSHQRRFPVPAWPR